ncbi:DNA primase, partial [Hydrobacter penzbergensis]
MDIAAIKEQLPIREVLQHYNLYPDKQNRLRCPFHDDSTPSLQVYYKTQTAYCFSSNCATHGKSMDVIDFIMYLEKCSKHEAIEKAKTLIGGDNQLQRLTRQAVLTKMFSYFKNAVYNSKPAQEYLQARCIDYRQTEVGYNAGQFHHGTRKDEALIKSCIEHGLLNDVGNKSRTGDTAYNVFGKWCIVFALKDSSNHVSGLYFRSTLNNQDQRHFYLKDRSGLYPKYPATDTKKLILTESIIDAATLLQIPAIASQYSVLALYGTNGFTQEHQAAIQSLTQLEEIIFWLNADQPGAEATSKHAIALQSLYTKARISCVKMPQGEDINSMAQAHDNMDVFIDLLEQRTADFSFSIEKENNNAGEQQEKAKLFIERGAPKQPTKTPPPITTGELDSTNPYKLRYERDTVNYYIQGGLPKTTDNMKIMLVIEDKASTQKARNRIDLYEDKQVEKLCKEAGEKLSLPAATLQADLYRLTDLLEQLIEKQLQQARPPEQALPVLTAKEREALQQFASKPKLIKRLNELLGKAGIVGEERNRIFLLIIAISHKTADTLHALIQG